MPKIPRVLEKTPRVTVLAIDPGFAELGYAVVRYERGMDHLLEVGIVTTKPTKDRRILKTEDQYQRLVYTSEHLIRVARECKIDALAFESLSIPRQTSKQSAIKIGHPYGEIAMLAAVLGVASVMVTPQQVKKSLCDSLKASKKEVEEAVIKIFGGQPAAAEFQKNYAAGRHNHGWDALAAYVAAGDTNVMKALKRSA